MARRKRLSQKGFATTGAASNKRPKLEMEGAVLKSRRYTGAGQGIGSGSPIKGKLLTRKRS